MNHIAEALRDLLQFEMDDFNGPAEVDQSQFGKLAMTCCDWRRIFSSLQWQRVFLTRTASVHRLEEIASSLVFGRHDDYFQELRLCPDGDINSDSFFSAWRSLLKHLHQAIHLEMGSRTPNHALKSFPIKLRPCPRPLLHLKRLVLQNITFPSFSALFRDIGALSSLEQLSLSQVRWKGACNPSSPPSSMATFHSITRISAMQCTELWPFVWILTTTSLRYGRPRRALDEVQKARTRSVREDTHAIVQTLRWMFNSTERTEVHLKYVELAPKGCELRSIRCTPRANIY